MKRLLIAGLALWAGSSVALAAEPPSWSFEIKAGRLQLEADQWQERDKDSVTLNGLALAYKLHRQWDIGLSLEYGRVSGAAFAPNQGVSSGRYTHELLPLNLFVTWRGVFNEDQWLVPYLGAGPTRVFYRQRIDHQDSVEGYEDGYHARVGLQLLLDRFDPRAARTLYESTGISNTYFYIEAMQLSAEQDGVELGGRSVLGGLLFEF